MYSDLDPSLTITNIWPMTLCQVNGQEMTPSPTIHTLCNGGLRERSPVTVRQQAGWVSGQEYLNNYSEMYLVFRKVKEQFSLMNITGTAEGSESNARFWVEKSVLPSSIINLPNNENIDLLSMTFVATMTDNLFSPHINAYNIETTMSVSKSGRNLCLNSNFKITPVNWERARTFDSSSKDSRFYNKVPE